MRPTLLYMAAKGAQPTMVRHLFIVLCLTAFSASLFGSEPEKPAVVSFVKVVSDKVPDISSIDAWKKAFIKDGMSDEEKALTVWKSVVAFRHQESPPLEYLVFDDTVNDAIKLFNVYGYCMCNG